MISIPEFYRNRDVLITGGSGFIMKVLIEKLFRSCSDIGRVFILMREKRSKSIMERLEEIKKMPLFALVMEKNPEIFDKLIAIEGDVTRIGLGVSDESRELLKDVSIIFHSAASVRFDDILRSAIILNTRGTHEMIKFALTLENLVSFVHVSTTYCYPYQRVTNEEIYPVYGDWRKTLEIAETLDDEMFECFMSHYTNFAPNSYVYTKALAEQICESYKDQLPITIVRPSIVVGTEMEPFGGWCDNYNGPVGLLTACGLGIMRTMHASHTSELNCVAVDIVAKTLIVAAWKYAMDNEKHQQLNCRQFCVYNCASLHNMDLKLLVYDGQYSIRKLPFEKCIWLPGGGVTLCKFMNYFRIIFFQLIPAAIIDQLLKVNGKRGLLMPLQRKIAHASAALKFFVFSEFQFGVDNFKSLSQSMLPEDAETFTLSRRVPNNLDYYEIQILGARRYLMKEPDSSLPASRRKIFIMLIFDRFIRFVIFGYLLYFLLNKTGLLNKVENLLYENRNDTIIERF